MSPYRLLGRTIELGIESGYKLEKPAVEDALHDSFPRRLAHYNHVTKSNFKLVIIISYIEDSIPTLLKFLK